VGAITWQEIEAREAGSLDRLRAWDKRLIRRMDVAVRAVIAAKADKTPPAPGQPDAPKDIPASNVKAVKAMFVEFAARHNARLEAGQEGEVDD
jgi:hypothetical protein